jgi:hypothetical protein
MTAGQRGFGPIDTLMIADTFEITFVLDSVEPNSFDRPSPSIG